MEGSILVKITLYLQEFQLVHCYVQKDSLLTLIIVDHFRDLQTSVSMLLLESVLPIDLEFINDFLNETLILNFNFDLI